MFDETRKARHILMITDPQNDFCSPKGSLYVDGADADMERLARHIEAKGDIYTDILISLDSHDAVAIFHPKYWVGEDGCNPAPYTTITPADYRAGKWRSASAENEQYSAHLFDMLDWKKIDYLMVWPEHCVVSTWGHSIYEPLLDSLATWRERTGQAVRYIFKGENPYTDQFSVFEGVDDSWGDMEFNKDLFRRFSAAESITFTGEALSHCVAASITSYMQRAVTYGKLRDQKKRLLVDCSSPVAGFSRAASEENIARLGVALMKSTDV